MQKRLREEMKQHCIHTIMPYWMRLSDPEWGGFYGLVNYDLTVDKQADKGVILNSRILYFFSRVYTVFQEKEALEYADKAYEFLTEKCWDKKSGGVYWMLYHDGSVKESMKHTYNQAFAIYALSAYYEATCRKQARDLALDLFSLIEEKCTDNYGYVEAFTAEWEPISNEKLSENGLLADKTMNTLLHLLEAYTLLYKITQKQRVKERLLYLLKMFEEKVWNEKEGRLEVFFDAQMNSIADLYSYGHDIEASWLIDYACEVLKEQDAGIWTPDYTGTIAEHIYERALKDGAVNNECFNGIVDTTRVWWVQAEAVVGFFHAYEKTKDARYFHAAEEIWEYIQTNFVDKREGGEWFWDLNREGIPESHKPITEPWKCPYHNGRMCMEIFVRQIQTKKEQGESER